MARTADSLKPRILAMRVQYQIICASLPAARASSFPCPLAAASSLDSFRASLSLRNMISSIFEHSNEMYSTCFI